MSCVEYESVEIEESGSESKGDTSRSKPFVVPSVESAKAIRVAHRVAEVLDFELAQGAMPA